MLGGVTTRTKPYANQEENQIDPHVAMSNFRRQPSERNISNSDLAS